MSELMESEQLRQYVENKGEGIPVASAIEAEGRDSVIGSEATLKPSPDKNILTKTTETPFSEGQKVMEDQQNTISDLNFDSKRPVDGNFGGDLVRFKNSGHPVPA